VRRAADGGDQHRGWRILHDAGIDPDLLRLGANVAVQRVEDDADAASIASHRLRDLDAAEVAHVRIEHEYFRTRGVNHAQRVVAVLGDADDDQSALCVEQIAQVLADRWMVVRDDDPQRSGRLGCHQQQHTLEFDGAEPLSPPTDQAGPRQRPVVPALRRGGGKVALRYVLVAGSRAGLVLLLAVALAACSETPVVVRPSDLPLPTASPWPFPYPEVGLPRARVTPTPTAAPQPPPQPTRTKQPQPTTRAAGEKLYPFYFAARATFPIFPPTPQIDFDFASDEDGDAFFRGLTPVGQPIFTVREDFVMTPRTAYHEIGHAYEALLQRKNASIDWRARYWAFRGFPGTWQQAAAEASTMTGMAQWIYQPQESWAEAFSVAMVGGGQEKTLDYGRTINPVATKAFFQSLLN